MLKRLLGAGQPGNISANSAYLKRRQRLTSREKAQLHSIRSIEHCELEAEGRQRRKGGQGREHAVGRCISVVAVQSQIQPYELRWKDKWLVWRQRQIAPKRGEVLSVLR